MRLITLNLWQGKLEEALLAFLTREALATDIFCFQEMMKPLDGSSYDTDVFSLISNTLPGSEGFFEPAQVVGESEFGLALFIKKSLAIRKEGGAFVHRARNSMIGDDLWTMGRNIQFIETLIQGQKLTIVNFQGLAMKDGRGDTDARIEQAKKLRDFIDTISGPKIICGDFNLSLNTKSMALIDSGMRNLIREYGITGTRNRFFPYPDQYCDYVLVDDNIKVNSFGVFLDEVSDHLGLFLDFDVIKK